MNDDTVSTNEDAVSTNSPTEASQKSSEPFDIDALADVELLNALAFLETDKENINENSHLLDSQIVRAENLAKFV